MSRSPQPPPPGLPDDRTVVGVVGLGYVGLPLAVEFGKRLATRGFDIDAERVAALARGVDASREVEPEQFAAAQRLTFTADIADLAGCDAFVVAVPTPVDEAKHPDLGPLTAASDLVGEVIRPGGVAVFESTVYPGATEEVCAPRIEAVSGLRCNRDFFVGYSPERINPGDRSRRLTDIVKLTAGSTPETADFVDALYGRIIAAGTYRALDIRTAEAAKVVENTQRDLNIALVNELAMIFHGLGLDTEAVLEAAGTKWNFLPFRPGLVGGHCLGVDPYYLAAKAEQAGVRPALVRAARRVNEGMGAYVAGRVAALMAQAGIGLKGSRVLVLGYTFKENCADARNTKVADLVSALSTRGAEVEVHDPWLAAADAPGVTLVAEPPPGSYDAVVVAVAHDVFRALGAERIRAFGKPPAAGAASARRSVLFDVKHLLPAAAADGRL